MVCPRAPPPRTMAWLRISKIQTKSDDFLGDVSQDKKDGGSWSPGCARKVPSLRGDVGGGVGEYPPGTPCTTGDPGVPQGDAGVPRGDPGVPRGTPKSPRGSPGRPRDDPVVPLGHPGVPRGHPGVPRGDPGVLREHPGVIPGYTGVTPAHPGATPGYQVVTSVFRGRRHAHWRGFDGPPTS